VSESDRQPPVRAIVAALLALGLLALLIFAPRRRRRLRIPTPPGPPAVSPGPAIAARPPPETPLTRDPASKPQVPEQPPEAPRDDLGQGRPVIAIVNRKLTVWWGARVPEDRREPAIPTWSYSNIEPRDYLGSEGCKSCHESAWRDWQASSHARSASPPRLATTPKAGGKVLSVTGKDGRLTLALQVANGDGKPRRFFVTRALGAGDRVAYLGHGEATEDEALFSAVWERREGRWMSLVEALGEAKLAALRRADGSLRVKRCVLCHETVAAGHALVVSPEVEGVAAPGRLDFDATTYLWRNEPRLLGKPPPVIREAQVRRWQEGAESALKAQEGRLGCESCHLGGREHVALKRPSFYTFASPIVFLQASSEKPHNRGLASGRSSCGRCHSAPRPRWPDDSSKRLGASFLDLMNGACSSRLRCTECHSPHSTQPPDPARVEAACIRCHDHLAPPPARRAHSHHAPGPGDRCVDCHMPRILANESGKLFPSHRIGSPVHRISLLSRGPNACGLCHGERPLEWAAGKLKAWFEAPVSAGSGVPRELLQSKNRRSMKQEWTASADPWTARIGRSALTTSDSRR